ncbi:p450 domain-containing protein [Cephalotus follicularis]|uniref:p450 domain-containing protein n=1 Tax=Cephalotus follicularis TaxID=3775 RepID=A0A1Q3CJT9_CEPFO|nr:p450 domain-containing protein [Cephalotus follicularis]
MDDFTLQSLCLSLLLLLTIFLYHKWKFDQSKSQSQSQPVTPPSPPKRLPIIGHLDLLTDMPHHSFAQLANQLGPIISLQLGRVTTVIISSAEHAQLVLKTHDHVFSNRPQLVSAQYLSFGCSDVTFSPYGPYWRQARKICVTELLSSQRVKSFQHVRGQEVNRLLSSVSTQSGSGGVDMSNLFFTLANDVLCRVAFGKRFVTDEGQKGNLAGVLSETQALFGGFCVVDFFPGWEWVINLVSGYKRRLINNLEQLRGVCDEIINEHFNKSSGTTTTLNMMDREEDFVDVLLRIQQRHDLEVPITNDNLKALVLDMFVAGTDTTTATLEWTMTQLARHPRVMNKAQEEVRKVASSSGKVDESHLQYLHYLKAVIKETMRLHPPVPLLVPRESMKTCVLDGYEIRAKTRVLINTYAIGRDPKSWDNPLEYNPERFDQENSSIGVKEQDFKFLPFGGGRRGCPGFTFGLATVEIALARLLYHFDWALPPGVGADDVDLSEIFGLATRKKSALVLVPTTNKDYRFDRDLHSTCI